MSNTLDGLNGFIEFNIKKLFSNKKYLTREIYINIYTKIYNFCTKKISFGSNVDDFKVNIFNQRKKFYYNIINIIKSICILYKEEIENSQCIINKYNDIYDYYYLCSKILDNIFEYFNRVFIRENDNSEYIQILDTCKLVWFKIIVIPLYHKLYQNINNIINYERKNRVYNNLDNIKSFLKSYLSLSMEINLEIFEANNINYEDYYSIYKVLFEKKYFKDTSIYVKSLNFTNLPILEYINSCNDIINFDLELCEKYLFNITYEPFENLLIKTLLLDNNDYISENIIQSLKENNLDVSKKIYNFYDTYCHDIITHNENNIICLSFSNFCKDYLNNKYKKFKEEKIDFKVYSQFIIKNYKYLKNIIKDVFNNNSLINKRFDDIFKGKINNKSMVLCDNLSKYINYLIKYCNKENIELDENEEFIVIMDLLKYVIDKDYLETYLKKHLSNRLLNKPNLDYEYILINKLKMLFSSEFVNKMNSMMSDINISKNLMEEYTNSEFSTKGFDVAVITNFIWNMAKYKKVEYPESLQKSMNNFTEFYNNKFKGRKLEWNNNILHGEIVCHCFNKKYIFNASIYQIDILNKFNYSDAILFEDNVFMKSLLKLNILKKVDDNVIINKDYKSKKFKQNIMNFKAKNKENVRKEEKEKIHFDRNLIIQSAIVRIMKTRKTLEHNQLVSQTVSLVDKFSLKISDIKKNIELLIDKEYIERQDNTKNIYNYLA